MSAYFQLVLAQLRIFFRNRSVIFFTLLFPVVLMIALGSFLGNGGGVSLSAILIDEDQTPASKNLIQSLEKQQVMSLSVDNDKTKAMDDLKQGDVQFVLVIPAGYGKDIAEIEQTGSLAGKNSTEVQVFYDETNLTATQIGLSMLNQSVDNVSKGLAHYNQWVTIQEQGIQAVNLKYIDFLVPGIVAMMIMSNNLNGVAAQIAAWRERGILRRMQSTPLRASTFIAAQITSRLILNGFQAMIVILIGSLFFGTQVNGSWLLLVFFVILGTLTFMSIGFIIAALAKTPESASPIAGFISFPMLFLGGIFFPIKNMPELLQPIVQLIPITHLSTALREVMNIGADLSVLWPEALLLGGWMVVAFAVASYSFKWE